MKHKEEGGLENVFKGDHLSNRVMQIGELGVGNFMRAVESVLNREYIWQAANDDGAASARIVNASTLFLARPSWSHAMLWYLVVTP